MSEGLSIDRCKRLALTLRRAFTEADADVKLGKCQQAIAAGFGFNTYAALLTAGGTSDSEFYMFDALDRLSDLAEDIDRDFAQHVIASVVEAA